MAYVSKHAIKRFIQRVNPAAGRDEAAIALRIVLAEEAKRPRRVKAYFEDPGDGFTYETWHIPARHAGQRYWVGTNQHGDAAITVLTHAMWLNLKHRRGPAPSKPRPPKP